MQNRFHIILDKLLFTFRLSLLGLIALVASALPLSAQSTASKIPSIN